MVAVEPQKPLRERLVAVIGAERVREGLAEAIPLPDACVEAVTVADGFHWFNQQRALDEIRRVLKPGGGLAVLSTFSDWSGASWGHELGTLIMRLRPEHPYFDGPPWQDAVRAARGWNAPREIRVITSQPTDPRRIVDHVASMSFVAALPEDERERWLAEVASLIEAGETPTELPVQVLVGVTAPA